MHSLIFLVVQAIVIAIALRLHRRWLREVKARRLRERAEANGECVRRLMLVEHGAPIELTEPVPPEVCRMLDWAYSDEGVVYADKMGVAA